MCGRVMVCERAVAGPGDRLAAADDDAADRHRMQSMMEALRKLHVPNSMGAALFLFATRDELRASDPLTHEWSDGNGCAVQLI